MTGPWCGWCSSEGYNVLSDQDGDGVYTLELPSVVADTLIYMYAIDGFSDLENLVDDVVDGGDCAPVTDFASYANRQIVNGGISNDVFGHCSSCTIEQGYAPSRVHATMTRQPSRTMAVAISHLAYMGAWMSMHATFQRRPSATMEVAIMRRVRVARMQWRATSMPQRPLTTEVVNMSMRVVFVVDLAQCMSAGAQTWIQGLAIVLERFWTNAGCAEATIQHVWAAPMQQRATTTQMR